MSEMYILDENGNPVEEKDLMKWAEWIENSRERRVAYDLVGEHEVSTVFLGLDHSFGEGEPLLFETMVFIDDETSEFHDYCKRYETKEQAVAGHKEVLDKIKEL